MDHQQGRFRYPAFTDGNATVAGLDFMGISWSRVSLCESLGSVVRNLAAALLDVDRVPTWP